MAAASLPASRTALRKSVVCPAVGPMQTLAAGHNSGLAVRVAAEADGGVVDAGVADVADRAADLTVKSSADTTSNVAAEAADRAALSLVLWITAIGIRTAARTWAISPVRQASSAEEAGSAFAGAAADAFSRISRSR